MKFYIEDIYTVTNKDKMKVKIRKRWQINVDKIIKQTIKPPIPTHIFKSSIAMYIENKYYPSNYTSAIHSHCGEQEVKNYLIE